MSSASNQPAPPTQSPAPGQRQPQVPFANWPTIKILNPPKGKFSPQADERCLTYCSQSVTGRFHQKEPWCRSICIRKVFAHEVRNLVAFKSHRNLDADGKARYPLPPEGQPANLPVYLGGRPVDPDGQKLRSREDTKYWEEGWYLWTSKSSQGTWEKIMLMRRDFQSQEQFEAVKEKRKKDWLEYQDHQKENPSSSQGDQPVATKAHDTGTPDKWWGPIIPPPPIQDVTAQSLLIPLPPPFPSLYTKVENLLAPTHKVLEILHESLVSGSQQEFAMRVWEKAWTKEPFVLANRACSRMWERWRNGPPDDSDDRKGST